jgi:hypothetical protein
MIDKVLGMLSDRKSRGLALAATGMGALMVGCKIGGLGLFGRGFVDLERQWREDNVFQGDWRQRWDRSITFYEETHRNPTNRALHIAGIPLILGGAVGLLAMPAYSPPWWFSAGAFGTGWAMNLVGHAVFEKNRPAFADDPLSFVAGPVWDLKQLRHLGKTEAAAAPG